MKQANLNRYEQYKERVRDRIERRIDLARSPLAKAAKAAVDAPENANEPWRELFGKPSALREHRMH